MKTRTALLAALSITGIILTGSTPALAAPADTTTAQSLQHMAIDEKLAHDTYATLASTYPNDRVFTMITRSETQHLSAVRYLMKAYGVTDPTAGDAAGVFDDAAVQSMYSTLVTEGKKSLADAGTVGVTVEKLDIADLDVALESNPPADVTRVLTNLRNASERHLAMFQSVESGTLPVMGQGPRGQGMMGQGARGQGPRGRHDGTRNS